jgi:hypothetical protein
MAMSKEERWEREALAALQAYKAAVGRPAVARRVRATGLPVDPDRAALDDRVRAHTTAHPGMSYADALDELVLALPPVDLEHEGVHFDR